MRQKNAILCLGCSRELWEDIVLLTLICLVHTQMILACALALKTSSWQVVACGMACVLVLSVLALPSFFCSTKMKIHAHTQTQKQSPDTWQVTVLWSVCLFKSWRHGRHSGKSDEKEWLGANPYVQPSLIELEKHQVRLRSMENSPASHQRLLSDITPRRRIHRE